jgi:glycosyltransferase involved in cell wall biosynthesis
VNVVIVGHCAQLSGAELATVNLVPHLLGVHVHVVLGEYGPLVDHITAAGATVEVLPMPAATQQARRENLGWAGAGRHAIATSAYTLHLASRLRSMPCDLVHTMSLKAALYGGAAARLAGVPVLWAVHDRIDREGLRPAAVALVRAAARVLPHAIVANSESTRSTLGCARHKTEVQYPAVSIAAVPRDSAHPFTVGIVGRLAPWKGQHVAVAAFARAFPKGDERLRIVGAPLFGEDEYERLLRRLSIDLGIADRVDFTGFTTDVAAELARIDVLAHCSVVAEPFGQVIVEGMAAGLPVVASAAGGPTEIVTHGVDGLLVDPGNEKQLAAAFLRLRNDGQLRRRLGDEACARADDFAPEVAATRLMQTYGRLAATSASPRVSVGMVQ